MFVKENYNFFETAAENPMLLEKLDSCITQGELTEVALNAGFSMGFIPSIESVKEYVKTIKELDRVATLDLTEYELYAQELTNSSPNQCSGGCQSVVHGKSCASSCCE